MTELDWDAEPGNEPCPWTGIRANDCSEPWPEEGHMKWHVHLDIRWLSWCDPTIEIAFDEQGNPMTRYNSKTGEMLTADEMHAIERESHRRYQERQL